MHLWHLKKRGKKPSSEQFHPIVHILLFYGTYIYNNSPILRLINGIRSAGLLTSATSLCAVECPVKQNLQCHYSLGKHSQFMETFKGRSLLNETERSVPWRGLLVLVCIAVVALVKVAVEAV